MDVGGERVPTRRAGTLLELAFDLGLISGIDCKLGFLRKRFVIKFWIPTVTHRPIRRVTTLAHERARDEVALRPREWLLDQFLFAHHEQRPSNLPEMIEESDLPGLERDEVHRHY